MAETTTIKAVELVRRIRDDHARLLAGKSDSQVIEFFRNQAAALQERASHTPVPETPGTGRA